MPKFFTAKNRISGNEIVLDEESSKHLIKVLRYKIGDKIDVCDGENTDYHCEILDSSENVKLQILSSENSKSEFPFEVILYQGIAKGEKMDNIIQKATELGITKIVPVSTKNTVVKLDGKEDKKITRWQKIALEAAKQSERGVIPVVENPISFKEAIKIASSSTSMICYGREDNYTLKNFFEDKNVGSDTTSISFFIGPEGGFDPKEIEDAKSLGIEPISLGDRILRTETASIAFLSMLQYHLF